MSLNCYRRNTCRLCESESVTLALPLVPCPPVDAYVTKAQIGEQQECFPMDLYLCGNCGHAQLLDVVSPKLLYGNYIYTTASSPGLVEYFRDYARNIHDQFRPGPRSLVVDVGSNDGTLLTFFKALGLRVLGVDPAAEIAAGASRRGIETLPEFFGPESARNIRQTHGAAAIVTANNVFAHADDLGSMADSIRELLGPDGVFVFEVSYLLDMVKNVVFDFIYHEHLSHHSVKPLKQFLRRHGMHLFDVERTQSKGGSIRCFAQLAGGPRPEQAGVDELIRMEEENALYSIETYRGYGARIDVARDKLKDLLGTIAGEGKTLAGYGASATSTVLVYHFGLGRDLQYIVDDNPDRQNRYSPGQHIPVVSSLALEETMPGYVLILVWRFAEMIIKRNEQYLKSGGRFIIPLPELTVVDKEVFGVR